MIFINIKIDNFVKSKNFNASQKPGLTTKDAEDAKSRTSLSYFKTIVSAIFARQRPDFQRSLR